MNISNNISIDPGSKISAAIGKIYCHSNLENNSDKTATIYHYCYLNGKTNAKIHTLSRNGKEYTILSDQKLEITNRLTWKVKITDDNKKILDTHIFELV
tara:strand:- start:171 stop:467 length:297 start_codon:yes stop_codon:yes gene_type:complete